jgi:hypothetical protein
VRGRAWDFLVEIMLKFIVKSLMVVEWGGEFCADRRG